MAAPKSTRQWILANKPTNLPELTGPKPTFELQTNEIPALKDDQVLVRALYISNDPAQRGWIAADIKPERLYVPPVQLNTPMHARSIAEVIDSKSPNFHKGQKVIASTGWSEYTVVDAKVLLPADDLPGGLPVTHYLGALGLTGITAYYGIKVVAETTPQDTVVVSGAAGATGMMVVQIAKKLIGCKKVIGIAGSEEKCKWVESLGADVCLNYKDSSFQNNLTQQTKDSLCDVYFDNVGGEILDFMLTRMAMHGRIAACGAISDYNTARDKVSGLKNWFEVISMRLQIRGFIVMDYLSKRGKVVGVFRKAIEEGKLKIGEESEHVVKVDFEDVPKTWMKLFEGGNTGKLITALQ